MKSKTKSLKRPDVKLYKDRVKNRFVFHCDSGRVVRKLYLKAVSIPIIIILLLLWIDTLCFGSIGDTTTNDLYFTNFVVW